MRDADNPWPLTGDHWPLTDDPWPLTDDPCISYFKPNMSSSYSLWCWFLLHVILLKCYWSCLLHAAFCHRLFSYHVLSLVQLLSHNLDSASNNLQQRFSTEALSPNTISLKLFSYVIVTCIRLIAYKELVFLYRLWLQFLVALVGHLWLASAVCSKLFSMESYCFPASCSLCEGCPWHRAVFYGQRSEPRCKRWHVLL